MIWPTGIEFRGGGSAPCPLDAECRNCGHQMRGHFRENRSQRQSYATSCGACPCNYWSCQHGGIETSQGRKRAVVG